MSFRGDTQPIYSAYFLRDPRTFEVRYIGQSTDPIARLAVHVSNSSKSKSTSRKLAWIDELRSLGTKPVLHVVLTGLTKLRAMRAEARLIFLHTQMNRQRLCNLHMDASKAVGSFGPSYIYLKISCAECGETIRRQNESIPPAWGRGEGGEPLCWNCKPRIDHATPFDRTNASLGLLESMAVSEGA